MTDLVLHIGLNKAGAGPLQEFFSLNTDALRAEGICYPHSGRDLESHEPLSKWLKTEEGRQSNLQTPLVKQLFDEIAGARTAVLSSEDFHTQGIAAVQKLAELFSGHPVQIVLYVREHLGYLVDWYQQNLQSTHLSCSFDKFCHYTRKPQHLIADRWVKVFGRSSVTVRLYAEDLLSDAGVVQDFANVIGLGDDLGRFALPATLPTPISGNLLYLKRLLNNFYTRRTVPDWDDDLETLAALRPTFLGPMQVDADDVATVMSMYRTDRQQLLNQYGIDIKPHVGIFEGNLSPDFATLKADWALVAEAASARGMALADACQLLSLGDLSRLQ